MPDHPSLEQVTQHLRQQALFEGVDDSILQDLARGARWRQYQAGEIVALEGEAQSGLYFLESGWLKIVKVGATGREQILRFLEPGETFNEIGIFANQPNPASIVALETAGIWLIRREVMLGLLQKRPAFAQEVIARMAERMLYLVSLVTDLSLRPVTGRLARLLIEDAQDNILHRPRWYTQAELAARLGTVPDVIQRALRTLENDELIAVERHQVRILDRRALMEIAA